MNVWYRLAKDQRGAAIVLVAVSMFAIIAAVALAVDASRLLVARTEAQRAADSGALAGAGWLMIDPLDDAGARVRAESFAEQNIVRGMTPDVDPVQDVDVILDSAKVRVRVRMQADRNLAIPTFFARVFGVSQVDVTTVAAAWAAPVAGVDQGATSKCLLPIALPDRYIDADGDGIYDEGEDPYDPQGTGTGPYVQGELISVKVSGSQNTGGPQECRIENESGLVTLDLCRELADSDNWRCWWKEDLHGGGGAEQLGARIYPGDGCDIEIAEGSTIYTSDGGGNKQSLANTVHEDFPEYGGACEEVCFDYSEPPDGIAETCEQQCPNGSFGDLFRADEQAGLDLYWDTSLNCPVDRNAVGPVECFTDYDSSWRIRSVPVVRPGDVSGTGANINTTVTEFMGVFIDKVACNYDLDNFERSNGNLNVYIRIMTVNEPGGSIGGDPGPGAGGTTVKKLQLIE